MLRRLKPFGYMSVSTARRKSLPCWRQNRVKGLGRIAESTDRTPQETISIHYEESTDYRNHRPGRQLSGRVPAGTGVRSPWIGPARRPGAAGTSAEPIAANLVRHPGSSRQPGQLREHLSRLQ